jgi:hypothetical protein
MVLLVMVEPHTIRYLASVFNSVPFAYSLIKGLGLGFSKNGGDTPLE